jgi:hypothetical protein
VKIRRKWSPTGRIMLELNDVGTDEGEETEQGDFNEEE